MPLSRKDTTICYNRQNNRLAVLVFVFQIEVNVQFQMFSLLTHNAKTCSK